jgi:ABC-2 type transport system ATP-binding protein
VNDGSDSVGNAARDFGLPADPQPPAGVAGDHRNPGGENSAGSNRSRTHPETDPGGVVETWELGKRYGDFDALRDCSFRVHRGDVFGLLGPNGAGKTTLIRLWLGFLRPTSGRCEVMGIDPTVDPVAARRHVAYLPGDARLPRHMRGKGVLKFFADMHPQGNFERSHRVAERLELDLRRHVAFMSTGMRQKLALSVVFGTRTPLMILDEPTANLDPTVRAAVLEMVAEAKDDGRTVVLSSHVLSEIEQSCDRVAFLRRGCLAHQLAMADLYQRHRVTARLPDRPIDVPPELADRVSVRQAPPRQSAERGGRIQIDTAGDLAPVISWLGTLRLSQVRIEPLGLKAVYDAVHFGREVKV